jgi:hypothetical protein
MCAPDDMGQFSRNELLDCINLKVAKDLDITEYWRDNHLLSSKLYRVVSYVLCIFTMSSAIQNVFSLECEHLGRYEQVYRPEH